MKDDQAHNELIEKAVALINDEARQEKLRINISKLAYKDSASVIAREVLKLAGYHS